MCKQKHDRLWVVGLIVTKILLVGLTVFLILKSGGWVYPIRIKAYLGFALLWGAYLLMSLLFGLSTEQKRERTLDVQIENNSLRLKWRGRCFELPLDNFVLLQGYVCNRQKRTQGEPKRHTEQEFSVVLSERGALWLNTFYYPNYRQIVERLKERLQTEGKKVRKLILQPCPYETHLPQWLLDMSPVLLGVSPIVIMWPVMACVTFMCFLATLLLVYGLSYPGQIDDSIISSVIVDIHFVYFVIGSGVFLEAIVPLTLFWGMRIFSMQLDTMSSWYRTLRLSHGSALYSFPLMDLGDCKVFRGGVNLIPVSIDRLSTISCLLEAEIENREPNARERDLCLKELQRLLNWPQIYREEEKERIREEILSDFLIQLGIQLGSSAGG